MPLTNTDRNSFFVTVAAGAISSVGFGMSILAICIVWILPKSESDHQDIRHIRRKLDKSRRRSAPPALSSVARYHQSKPSAALVPINSPPSGTDGLTRHVYFVDSPTRSQPARRYVVPVEVRHPTVPDIPNEELSRSNIIPLHSSPTHIADASPRSSSSTLVHTTNATPPYVPTLAPQQPGTYAESAVEESDHSARLPSSRRGLRLPGLMSKHRRKASEATPTITAVDATQSDDPTSKPVRRASTGLHFTRWSSRNRTGSDLSPEVPSVDPPTRSSSTSSGSSYPRRPAITRLASIPTPPYSPSPTSPSSTTSTPTSVNSSAQSTSSLSYFSRRASKARRRQSAPANAPPLRTQPYDYPYFAAPPRPMHIDIEKADDLVEDEDNERTPMPPKTAIRDPEIFRGRERKPANTQAQTALGVGRPVPQRRSASESWASGSRDGLLTA